MRKKYFGLAVAMFLLNCLGISPAVAQNWVIDDVGTHTQTSSVTISSDGKAISVQSNGAEAFSSFTFVNQSLNVDAELVARLDAPVTSVATMRRGLKVGTSVGEGLFLLENGGQVTLHKVGSSGVPSLIFSAANVAGSAPLWMKLKRVGSTISAYQSANGTNWQTAGYSTESGWTAVLWGLVASAGDVTGQTQCHAPFAKVSLITNVPMLSSKMRLWLRADDGVAFDTSNRVTNWADHSGNANHVTQPTAANAPTWSSGSAGAISDMPFVTFGTDKYLSAPDSSSLKPVSNIRVYTVTRRTSGSDVAVLVEKFSPTTAGYTLQMQTSNGRRFYTNAGGTSGTVATADALKFAVVEGFLEVPGNRTVRVNGNIIAESAQITANFSGSSNSLYVGGRAANYNLPGDIAEVLIFGDKLEDYEARQVDAYLFSKYGVGTKPLAVTPSILTKTGIYPGSQLVTITGAPGYDIYYTLNGGSPVRYEGPFQISSTTTLSAFSRRVGFDDSQITQSVITIDSSAGDVPVTDRVLWLRADTGIMHDSGGYVYQWNDQSGAGNDAVQANASALYRPLLVNNALNGQPAVQFDPARQTYLESQAAGAATVSILAVFKNQRTATAALTQILAERFHVANLSGHGLYLSSYIGRNFRINNGITTHNLPAADANQYQIWAGIYDQSTRRLLINGQQVGSASMSAASGTPDVPLRIGGRAAANNVHGELAELLVYNRAITEAERSQIEIYLYSRYQVGTQPVAAPPTNALNSGTYLTAQNATLSIPGQDPLAYIRYTTDGTEPNASSPVYTGPVPITTNTTLKARTIRPPFADSPVQTWFYAVDPASTYVPSSGLELWLRGDAGVDKGTGDWVSRWIDMGGAGTAHVASAAQSTSPQWVMGPQGGAAEGQTPRLDLSGNDKMEIPDHAELRPARFSAIAVVRSRQTDTGTPAGVISKAGTGLGYYIAASAEKLSAGAGSVSFLNTPNSWNWEQGLQIIGIVYESDDDVKVYRNGAQQASGTLTTGLNTPAGLPLLIGKNTASGSSFDGEIAEILFYSRGISNTERQSVEAYLSQKYAISAAVPKLWHPLISVLPAPFTPGMSRQVSMWAEASAEIRYTLDGTEPTEHSLLFNSASSISVFEACTVKAKAFKPGYITSETASADIVMDHEWKSVSIRTGYQPVLFSPSWAFNTDATGFANAGDSLACIVLPCGKGGYMEWASFAPVSGMIGITMRASYSPLSASAFVGFQFGDSNCYYITRAGNDLQTIRKMVVPGVSPGDSLRLELIGNTVVLKTKAPGQQWQTWWGTDLYQPADGRQVGIDLIGADGKLVESVVMGVAACKAENPTPVTSIYFPDTTLSYSVWSPGIRWNRAQDVVNGLGPNINEGVYARQRVTHSGRNGNWSRVFDQGAGIWTAGDSFRGVGTPEDPSIGLSHYVDQCPAGDLNLFVRLSDYGTPGQQVRIRAIPFTGSEVSWTKSIGSDSDLWAYVGTVSLTKKEPLQLVIDNLVDGGNAAQALGFDAFFLAAVSAQPDVNRDYIPDGLNLTGDPELPSDWPFVPWGDFDGDGWSNFQRLDGFLESSRSVTFSREAGDNGGFYMARGTKLKDACRVVATYTTYPGGPAIPVPGYPVHYVFSGDTHLLTPTGGVSPLYGIAADSNDISIYRRRFVAFTGLDGRVTCDLEALSKDSQVGTGDCSVYAQHPPGQVSSNYTNAQWRVGIYENVAPGPILVSAENWKIGLAAEQEVAAPAAAPVVAVKDQWMAVGHPVQTLSSVPNEGYADLWKWDSLTGQWTPALTLAAPAGSGGAFGRSIHWVTLYERAYLAVGAAQCIALYPVTWRGEIESQPESVLRFAQPPGWESVAYGNNELAIGCPGFSSLAADGGKVEIYKASAGTGGNAMTWTLSQTLTPSSGKHSDRFGTSVAYSPAGTRLAVGAPVNLGWHYDPANEPYFDEGLQQTVTPASPADPAVYIFELNTAWQQEARIEKPSETSLFGWWLTFADEDDLLASAPYWVHGEGSTLQHGPGKVRLLHRDALQVWAETAVLEQGHPDFGRNLSYSEGRLASYCPDFVQDSSVLYPKAVHFFPFPWSGNTPVEALHPAAPIQNMFLEGDECFLVSGGRLSAYEFMPAVSAGAPPGKVATVEVEDINVKEPTVIPGTPLPDFTDSVTLSLMTETQRFEVVGLPPNPPNWPKFEIHVKQGASLADLAGTVAWLQLEAADFAGEQYQEALGLRITGAPPQTPSLTAAHFVGRGETMIEWQALSLRPDVYIVERAEEAAVASANGDPLLLDSAFSEIHRLSGWKTLVRDAVSGNVVYRLKAENKEGISAVSNMVTLLADSDGDQIPDWWEMLHAGNLTAMNGLSDTDADQIEDIDEYLAGSNPLEADTDGDGVPDLLDPQPLDMNLNGTDLVLFNRLEK